MKKKRTINAFVTAMRSETTMLNDPSGTNALAVVAASRSISTAQQRQIVAVLNCSSQRDR
jgi:hypothetical protein